MQMAGAGNGTTGQEDGVQRKGKDAWLLGYIWEGGGGASGCGRSAHQRQEDSNLYHLIPPPIFIYLKRKKVHNKIYATFFLNLFFYFFFCFLFSALY